MFYKDITIQVSGCGLAVLLFSLSCPLLLCDVHTDCVVSLAAPYLAPPPWRPSRMRTAATPWTAWSPDRRRSVAVMSVWWSLSEPGPGWPSSSVSSSFGHDDGTAPLWMTAQPSSATPLIKVGRWPLMRPSVSPSAAPNVVITICCCRLFVLDTARCPTSTPTHLYHPVTTNSHTTHHPLPISRRVGLILFVVRLKTPLTVV